MAEDSAFISKGPCDECGSSDANALYDDGHTHCFSCGAHGNGVQSFQTKSRRTSVTTGLINGEVRALPKRNLTEETCKHWGYKVGEYNGKPVQIATYCDEAGDAVAQKIRFPDKDFKFIGEPKKAGLYGQHLWRDGGRKVVITEGEIDALSVSQLQSNKWPVVSVPNGAQGAKKSIAKAVDWLERFDEVVFLFDDDEPGREAAVECAALLTPGKAKIARINGFKDANEALQAKEGPKVIDAIWGAKTYRPDGVVGVEDVAEEAAKEIKIGIPWPWPALTEATYGIRSTELYALGAGTGIGKTDTFKDIVMHLAKLGHKCGLVFLEEPPARTLKVLAGKYLKKRIHVPGVVYSQEEQKAAFDYLNERIVFFQHFGAMDYETVKERIRYMVTALDCKHIFLDHLTALAAGIEDGDERKAIDFIMADLASLAQQLNFTLYFISHLTTPEGTSHEEGGRVLEKHFRGSRSIGFWSHFMFALERDKQDQDGVTTFRVLKDRYTGDANGVTFGLRYNRTTGISEQCEIPTDGESPAFTDESTGDF